MLRIRALSFFLLLLATAPATTQAPAPAPEWHAIAPGVRYRHLRNRTPAGEPWSIHVLEISRAEKSLEIRAAAGAAEDGSMARELPTAMARQFADRGARVLATVNGDYDLPAPYLGISDGLSVTSGVVWTTGRRDWPNFALLRSGEPVIAVPEANIELRGGGRAWRLPALNKPFGLLWGAGPRLFSRQFRPEIKSSQPFDAVVVEKISPSLPLRAEAAVRGQIAALHSGVKELAIPEGALVLVCRASDPAPFDGPRSPCRLRAGERIRLRIEIRMARRKGVRHAIGGFPILVEQGRRSIPGNPGDNLRQRHPRTAVCTNERQILFVVVDGRQPELSVGMTLEELADLMVALGCTTAMNTDGGGSSVMAVALPVADGGPPPLRIVNSPSDGRERGRGNAWVVLRKR
jgi:hypothetical protein